MIDKKDRNNVRLFSLWSKVYDHGPVKWWLTGIQKKVCRIIEENSKKNNVKLLDIGCGTGDLLLMLANKKRYQKLCGADLTGAMIKIAEKKLKQYKNISLAKAPAVNLPFKNEMFDIAITTEAFHHFPEPEKSLEEIRRVLKKKGGLVLADIYFGRIASAIFCMLEPGCVRVYSKKEIRKLLEKAGFKVIRQQNIGFFATCSIAEKQQEGYI
ncbi:MAG: class I SAM-dependent methyltransferase [Nanoarchaeota archaeon]